MTKKIAISLPDDVVAAAREAVSDGRAKSVSAFIADAINEHRRYEDVAAFLAEATAEGGEPTEDDRAWARSALGLV